MDIVIYSFIVGSGIHDQTNKPRSSFVGRAVSLNGSQGEKRKTTMKTVAGTRAHGISRLVGPVRVLHDVVKGQGVNQIQPVQRLYKRFLPETRPL